VGPERLNRLARALFTSDLDLITPPKHGMNGKKNAIVYDVDFIVDLQRFVRLLNTEPWPEELHAGKTLLLPPETTMPKIYSEFKQSQRLANRLVPCYTHFNYLFATHISDVEILDPCKDVCNYCASFRQRLKAEGLVFKNLSPEPDLMREWLIHVNEKRNRRRIYRIDCILSRVGYLRSPQHMTKLRESGLYYEAESHQLITEATSIIMTARKEFMENGVKQAEWALIEIDWDNIALLCRIKVISSDYKQNAMLPYDPIQANAFYYSQKRAVYIFGIVLEWLQQHHIRLYDETVGQKTANEICSMLFDVIIAAVCTDNHVIHYSDNCCGQIKNRCAFMLWLVNEKRVQSYRAKFMVVGHTHFSPDRGFAWIQAILKFRELYCPNDVLKACRDTGGIHDATLLDKFINFKDTFEELYGEVVGIRNFAEVMVTCEEPTSLFVRKTLSCSVVPDRNQYERRNINNFMEPAERDEILAKFRLNPSLISKQEVSEKKKTALRKLFYAGIVPRYLSNYYFSEQNQWSSINEEETIAQLRMERKKELQQKIQQQLQVQQNKREVIDTKHETQQTIIFEKVIALCKLFEDSSARSTIEQLIRSNGGIVQTRMSKTVTHVICWSSEISAKDVDNNRIYVTTEWILDSIKSGAMLEVKDQQYSMDVIRSNGKKRKRSVTGANKRCRQTKGDDTNDLFTENDGSDNIEEIQLQIDVMNDDFEVMDVLDEATFQYETVSELDEDVDLNSDLTEEVSFVTENDHLT
jgi:hypothetical protein